MMDTGEKCAVFGVYGRNLEVGRISFFGLFALQHRGQESSGIAVSDGNTLYSHKGMGLVTHVYQEEVIEKLLGYAAIGHNRYSTSQGSLLEHAQPLIIELPQGKLALAHNGNLPSTAALQAFLGEKGIVLPSASDSRLMAEAVACVMREGVDLPDALARVAPLFTGAYALLALHRNTLVAMRDSCGIRPLSMARLNGGFVFSSETCSFGTIGASFERDVKAGEMVVIDETGMRAIQVFPGSEKLDVFEFVYFARPDSMLSGRLVYDARKAMGAELAREYPLQVDIVVPVPETAVPAAIGYSSASGIPLETALVKNRYIHRTFIQPDQHLRAQGVKMKLAALPQVLAGKRVALVDDSIVRGTTSSKVVRLLFEAGAREVHLLVSSPPIRYPDFYGIDIASQKELLAFGRTPGEMAHLLGATSINYLSVDGMIRAVGLPPDTLCTSCFTGEYPIDVHERRSEFVAAEPAVLPSVDVPPLSVAV